jgi:dienelactone hydrolase
LLLAVAESEATMASSSPNELTRLAPGVLHESIATPSDPTQSYALYLPSSFKVTERGSATVAATGARAGEVAPKRAVAHEELLPLLLVFDPRSRGAFAAEIFLPAAERFGWIVASSNNTMSDGPWEPNVRAVNAMVPDLLARLPIDRRRIYATGFSGGAMVAWLLGLQSGQLAGVIAVGGRPPDGIVQGRVQGPPSFALWSAAGSSDFNYRPSLRLDEQAAEAGVAHRFEPFDGVHAWFRADEAERAVSWLEVLAMRDGLRPRDEAWIDATLRSEIERVEAHSAAGDALGALRALRASVETYRGLRDVGVLEAQLRELEGSAATVAAQREDARAVRYETAGLQRLGKALAELRESEPVPPVAKLETLLGLSGLLRDADEEGAIAAGARRVLASMFVQFGFYAMRDFLADESFTRAARSLTLALEIDPDKPGAWYNLACAEARSRRKAAALVALEQAIAKGYADREHLASDPDLESLREEPRYLAVLASLE